MTLQAFLPLITYPDANSERVALHAGHVAGHLGAELHAVVFEPEMPKVSSALGNMLLDVPGMVREVKATCRARGRSLTAAVRREAENRGIRFTCETLEEVPGSFGDAAALHARYHDIALTGWERASAVGERIAEAILFGSGRPMLLLPDDSAAESDLSHVAVAWDGSRVAARAVADARIFLERARKVSVVTVAGDKPMEERDAAGRLAEHLGQYGTEAVPSTIEGGRRAVGDTLQEHAKAVGAGLLVMGGYGHSRLRAFVLGGATQSVLADLRLPVLMSH